MNEDFASTADEAVADGPSDEAAVEALERFFEDNRETVFFSRQLEVAHEQTWYHWITSRAVRQLIEDGKVRDEYREMTTRGTIHLMWHKSYRYYRREASRVVGLVEQYAHPDIGQAMGLHGESMILEGFASQEFVMRGRETNSFEGREWTRSGHDLDFIFERDGVAYGVEVKNTLGYMPVAEMRTKIEMCRHLGVRPLFAARMMPKSWIHEVNQEGGFALILKYQLYPWTHRELAKQVREAFDLPVDSPKRLYEATMQRFVRWHEARL